MTMHLHHPSLSLNGKKKGKTKFRSAAEAQRFRELEESWKNLKQRWNCEQQDRKQKYAMSAPVWKDKSPIYRDSNDKNPKSLNTWVTGAVSSKPSQQYTGSKIIGIGTMHKSNAVPIFNDNEAKEISSMRR